MKTYPPELAAASPDDVWCILLSHGMEVVTKLQPSHGHAGEFRLMMGRPFVVRTIDLPREVDGGRIHVNTTPQMQPLTFFMSSRDLYLPPELVWRAKVANKKVADQYIELTTGISVVQA